MPFGKTEMDTSAKPDTTYGDEPGIRFALLLDAQGGSRQITLQELLDWKPQDGVLWLHLERDHPAAVAWINERSGLDPLVREALLAEESRPRVEPINDGLLITLRGVCGRHPSR